MANLSIDTLLTDVGADADAIACVKAKGIMAVAVLAKFAASETQLEQFLVQPFVVGVTVAGNVHKYTGDPNTVKAVLTAAWEDAMKAGCGAWPTGRPSATGSRSRHCEYSTDHGVRSVREGH